MKSMARPAGGLELRKEMQLSPEPVRMVNMKLRDVAAAACEEMSTLQIHELSNLDQLYDYYSSVALFYDVLLHHSGEYTDRGRNGVDEGTRGAAVINGPVKRLQGALEELLEHHPAAAGRLCHCVDNTEPGRLQIEYFSSAQSCHSGYHPLHGVPFVVAHANIALCELGDVSHPHPSLDLLYPTLPKTGQDSSGKYLPRPVMAMQVTTFTCGGFCLAHMCSHAFMDGHAGATFLQNMCSIARGAGLTVLPEVLSSRREIMKPRMPPSPSPTVMQHAARVLTRKRGEEELQLPYSAGATRFAFSTAALEALRRKASSSSTGSAHARKPCSRYQALAALLLIARAKSLRASSTERRPASQELNLWIPMNLREKGIPGLTPGYIGNALFQCFVRSTLQELCESSLPSLVCKIRSALGAGMDKLSECAQSQIDYIELQLRAGLVPYLDCTCSLAMPLLVNLPFYDTDCGWGRPVYCGRPSRQLGHLLIILDHPAARAWNVLAVFNSQEEHAAFQQEIAEYIIC